MTKSICDAYLGGEAFISFLDVSGVKYQSIQWTEEQSRKLTFDLYHQVIIQDRDFDLNKYIMDLAFKLQELSSSLQSLMFELEENPAPKKTIDSIMKRMSRIIKITMDHHRGGLSHHINTNRNQN